MCDSVQQGVRSNSRCSGFRAQAVCRELFCCCWLCRQHPACHTAYSICVPCVSHSLPCVPLQVAWSSTPADALSVKVSTNAGGDFCDVSSGVPLSDFLHVAGAQQLCLFPTVSIKVVVQWKSSAVLTALSVTFLPKHPQEFAKPPVVLGMNLGRRGVIVGGLLAWCQLWYFCLLSPV